YVTQTFGMVSGGALAAGGGALYRLPADGDPARRTACPVPAAGRDRVAWGLPLSAIVHCPHKMRSVNLEVDYRGEIVRRRSYGKPTKSSWRTTWSAGTSERVRSGGS